MFLDLPSSVTTETEILETQNIECLELTNQKSLNIKAKNRLRSTLSEGVATLVLVKIQLFLNINLETNISFKSCQYKKQLWTDGSVRD